MFQRQRWCFRTFLQRCRGVELLLPIFHVVHSTFSIDDILKTFLGLHKTTVDTFVHYSTATADFRMMWTLTTSRGRGRRVCIPVHFQTYYVDGWCKNL